MSHEVMGRGQKRAERRKQLRSGETPESPASAPERLAEAPESQGPILELVKGGPAKHDPGPDGWPVGFYVSKTGLYFQEPPKEEGDQAPAPVWLGTPIEILGWARDGASEGWSLLLRFKDPDGVEHDYILARGKLAGDPSVWIGEMMGLGWKANTNPKRRSLLVGCFLNAVPKGRIRTVPRTGWTDDEAAFVLPSETLGGEGEEDYRLSPPPAKDIFSRGGTFAAWTKTIGLWAIGNYLLFFALAAALAGPLLKLLGLESGGLHLYGGTSSGKTTILDAACSVWGRPDVFGGANWRSTDNGLELRAALHSDCLLPLDEIGQAPEKAIKEAAYLLSNETGKTKATRASTLRTPARWRILGLSTGEIEFSTAVKQAGETQKGGQAVRIIDLPADAGKGLGAFQCLHNGLDRPPFDGPAALSEAIKNATKENHGHAGPEFVRRLLAMPDRDKTLRAIFEKMRAALTPDKAAPEVARAVKRFALIATAGELATRWGFFEGCAKGGAESLLAVRFCLDAWLTARGGAGSLAEVQARDRLLDFIGKHGARFQDICSDERVINRAGFKVTLRQGGGTEFLILPEVFQGEICAGLNYTQVAHTLTGLGLLRSGDGKNLARYRALPDLGKQRVFVAYLAPDDGTGEEEGYPL